MLDKKTLAKIKAYFKKQPDVVAVYLYGSEVSGRSAKPEVKRDVDLAILFKQPKKSYDRLFAVGNRVQDFIDKQIDCREINSSDPPVYLMNILKRGQLVYSGNEDKRINFEITVMREYEDTQHLRDVQYFYLKKRLEEGRYGVPN